MGIILIADDDFSIAQLVSDALIDEGYQTEVKTDSASALAFIEENKDRLSLILLDIMMPDMSGLEVCRMVRDLVKCPILFMTAKSKTIDKVVGFEMGGDDYITKPFVVEEVVARVKAHLRRDKRTQAVPAEMLKIGTIELRCDTVQAFRDKKQIALSTREFQLLEYLMRNAGKVLTREMIYSHVWNTEFGDIGCVAVNIKNLRDKIDKESDYIKTIWGVGYKFVTPKE